jgi:hypothetical protein
MASQISYVLSRPYYLLTTVIISIAYGVLLLQSNHFLFFAPYFVVFVPSEAVQTFLLDITLSIVTSIVLSLSIHQIILRRSMPSKSVRTGVLGIAAGLLAGACPCNYLVPVLTLASGVGGALGALGTVLNEYEFPMKLGSLAILIATVIILERTSKATCRVR